MKKYTTLFLLAISTFSFSQTIAVTYSEKSKVSEEALEKMPTVLKKIRSKSYDYDFVYSNGVSMYKNAANTKNIDTLILPNADENKQYKIEGRFTYNFFEKYYYKNLNQNKFLFHFFDGNNDIDGKDTLLNFNWQITDETQTICGYECKKAISTLYGYYFIAWFTDKIPVNDGPEKFDGLPGLILKVENDHFVNEAKKISFLKEDTLIEEPKFDGKTYTMKEIDDYNKQKFQQIKKDKSIFKY